MKGYENIKERLVAQFGDTEMVRAYLGRGIFPADRESSESISDEELFEDYDLFRAVRLRWKELTGCNSISDQALKQCFRGR